MKNELDVICDVSQRFDTLGIPYMLTGSMAMNYYAEPRMTRDIDLVVEITAQDVESLVSSFSDEYYIEESSVRNSVQHTTMFNIIELQSVIKVDCIIRKDTEYRQVEFERRRRIELGDVVTYIVSKEDLILSKLFWAKDSHSEIQLKDVANLMSSGYDNSYVDTWKDGLGVAGLLKELGHE